MKGRNTYGIVIIKSLYCLNVYERQKYIWYCNINESLNVLFKMYMKGRNTYGIVILKSLYCLNVYERQNTYGIVILKSLYCLNI